MENIKAETVLDLDADALGEALAPLFPDSIKSELLGLFPRITSRYQYFQGHHEKVQEFLYRQLGVSIESQEIARSYVSDEVGEKETIPISFTSTTFSGNPRRERKFI